MDEVRKGLEPILETSLREKTRLLGVSLSAIGSGESVFDYSFAKVGLPEIYHRDRALYQPSALSRT